MDDILRSARGQCHVQGIKNQLAVQGRGHRPTDDAAAERIECDRQVEEAGPRRHESDIGHPQQIRALGREIAIDQIGRPLVPVANGRGDKPAAADTGKIRMTHQTGDPFLADSPRSPTTSASLCCGRHSTHRSETRHRAWTV